jgi:ATP-dependent Lon protease
VLPVGGIKMKVLAAHRAGLKTVILPRRNASDVEDLPEEVRSELTVVTVDHIDEAIAGGFADQPGGSASDRGNSAADTGGGNECDTDLTPMAC